MAAAKGTAAGADNNQLKTSAEEIAVTLMATAMAMVTAMSTATTIN